jgi:hypothetical protein
MADASAKIQTELDKPVQCVVMLIGLRECYGSDIRRDNYLFGKGVKGFMVHVKNTDW